MAPGYGQYQDAAGRWRPSATTIIEMEGEIWRQQGTIADQRCTIECLEKKNSGLQRDKELCFEEIERLGRLVQQLKAKSEIKDNERRRKTEVIQKSLSRGDRRRPCCSLGSTTVPSFVCCDKYWKLKRLKLSA